MSNNVLSKCRIIKSRHINISRQRGGVHINSLSAVDTFEYVRQQADALINYE